MEEQAVILILSKGRADGTCQSTRALSCDVVLSGGRSEGLISKPGALFWFRFCLKPQFCFTSGCLKHFEPRPSCFRWFLLCITEKKPWRNSEPRTFGIDSEQAFYKLVPSLSVLERTFSWPRTLSVLQLLLPDYRGHMRSCQESEPSPSPNQSLTTRITVIYSTFTGLIYFYLRSISPSNQ